LAAAKVKNGTIEMPGNSYRVIVVPSCELMPLPTLKKLIAFAESGATVIFENGLPKDVPGLSDLANRRAQFRRLLARANGARASGTASSNDALETRRAGDRRSVSIGKGRVLVGELEPWLTTAGVARETA